MRWFKKSYFFIFFSALFYVVCSSNGLITDIATEMVLASDYVANANASLAETEVIPGGEVIGIKLYTDGILVVELASFENCNGEIVCPAKDSGIEPGDKILAVNGKEIADNSQLTQEVALSGGRELSLTVDRNGSVIDITVNPQKSLENNLPKIGIWVRDSAAGIGTLTFVRKSDNRFFALGHSIADRDIRENYSVKNGTIEYAKVMDIVKSKEGVPGEIQATFGGTDVAIGTLEGNSDSGIFGTFGEDYSGETMKLASRWQIKEGPATILCSLDGAKPEEYSININKVILAAGFDEKSMVIEVTDPELIKKTGGIVQGMSGSPILQNGKIVGAVTHVFVNDPTRGYGIFIENMLAEAEKIK